MALVPTPKYLRKTSELIMDIIMILNRIELRLIDFLKELQLTEGRATGFPKIYDAMKRNGSPEPTFDTDDDRTYFLAILPVHPEVKDGGKDGGQAGGRATEINLNDTEKAMLEILEGGHAQRPN